MNTRRNLRLALAAIMVALLVPALALMLFGARLSHAEGPELQGGQLAATSLGTAFNYQGYLTDALGDPVSGTCDLRFRLYDAASGGAQVGSDQVTGGVSVSNGYFAIAVDFGPDAFDSEARWLEVAVKVAGDPDYTSMPRQAISPVPYALALPGLRTEENFQSPNVIGGSISNTVASFVVGGTIGGGGAPFSGRPAGMGPPIPNSVTDDYGTVGGGGDNRAGNANVILWDAAFATVAGGVGNTASGDASAVGGGCVNTASGYDATVSGGGGNEASGDYAYSGGGYDNVASADYATVSGGESNEARAEYATISGGGRSDPYDSRTANRVTDDYGTVGGGGNNQAGDDDQDTSNARFATVGGGFKNIASASRSTVAGGNNNVASSVGATVGAGVNNTASGMAATVGGGAFNTADGYSATVAGGHTNTAGGYVTYGATVSGGEWNAAVASYATVSGGHLNTAGGNNSTVGGGHANTASGAEATVPGGGGNLADGDFSLAAGRQAQALHDGAFVWADSHAIDYASGANNEFRVRASGGVYLHSNLTASTGVYLAPGGTSWQAASDRALKENLEPVDAGEILARLASMPVHTWNLVSQDPAIRHVGPVAQDFHAAFGFGESDTAINMEDADGVAMAAIQELYQLVQEQAAHIQSLETRLASLEARLASLEARLASLEATLAPQAVEGRL